MYKLIIVLLVTCQYCKAEDTKVSGIVFNNPTDEGTEYRVVCNEITKGQENRNSNSNTNCMVVFGKPEKGSGTAGGAGGV